MNRLRRGNLLALSGASALQAAFNMAAALVSTRLLGSESRGVMVLGLTIGSTVALAAGLGTGTAFRSSLPSSGGGERVGLVSAYTWCSAGAAALGAGVAVGVTRASAPLIDPALGGTGFLLAVGTYALAQVLSTQMVEAWFADGRFRRGTLAAAAMNAGGLVGVLASLAVTRSAAAVLVAQALGSLIVIPAVARRLHGDGLIRVAKPRVRPIARLVRRGAPSLALSVGLSIALRADRYLLGAAAGVSAVAVYTLAATLSEAARLVPAALGQLFLRDVASSRRAAGLLRTSALGSTVAAVVGLLLILSGWVLIVPVFGADFTAARTLLMVLVLAEVCFAPYFIASRGLLGGGWTKTAGALGAGSACAAVGCYAFSVGAAGAIGAATGSVVVYATLSVVSCGLLRRRSRQGELTERALPVTVP